MAKAMAMVAVAKQDPWAATSDAAGPDRRWTMALLAAERAVAAVVEAVAAAVEAAAAATMTVEAATGYAVKLVVVGGNGRGAAGVTHAIPSVVTTRCSLLDDGRARHAPVPSVL